MLLISLGKLQKTVKWLRKPPRHQLLSKLFESLRNYFFPHCEFAMNEGEDLNLAIQFRHLATNLLSNLMLPKNLPSETQNILFVKANQQINVQNNKKKYYRMKISNFSIET